MNNSHIYLSSSEALGQIHKIFILQDPITSNVHLSVTVEHILENSPEQDLNTDDSGASLFISNIFLVAYFKKTQFSSGFNDWKHGSDVDQTTQAITYHRYNILTYVTRQKPQKKTKTF